MPAKLRLHGAPAMLVFLAVILALAVTALVALSGAEAANKQPKCGDTITTDTTLHHDLVNCPNNGIIIGADNVTLDLNGHTIDGDGTPFSPCGKNEWCDIGVVNLGRSAVVGTGHDGVTVMHGSVHGFAAGVNIAEASHNRVLGISASSNHFFAIGLVEVARSLVRNSSGSGSMNRKEGTGIGLFGSHHVRVLDSSFRHNPVGVKPVGSTNSVVKGNVIAHNGDEGLLMEGGQGFQIRHNRFVGNGLTLGPGSRNVITLRLPGPSVRPFPKIGRAHV